MIKDVCKAAALLLGLEKEASETGGGTATDEKFLRLYNLVVSELFDVYRRNDYAEPPFGKDMNEEQARFYGISDRVLAYGIAAEYAVAECLDTAEMWDTRYRNAIALAPRKSVNIPSGRFY